MKGFQKLIPLREQGLIDGIVCRHQQNWKCSFLQRPYNKIDEIILHISLIHVHRARPAWLPEEETSTHWAIVQIAYEWHCESAGRSRRYFVSLNNFSGTDIFYLHSLMQGPHLPPGWCVCVAYFLVQQASLGILPVSDTGCVPHLLPFLCGVEAKNSPPMRISLKPGRETAPGLSNNCADCANTILVQELLYSLCHLEGQNFYLGQSSGMPPHVFLNGEFCCVFRVWLNSLFSSKLCVYELTRLAVL